MKRKKNLIKVAFLCMTLVAVFTFVFATNSKTNAKAGGFFEWLERESIRGAAISLEQDTYNWTGNPIKPKVRVNLNGTDLEQNVDYVVKYENNVDAGKGRVIIEGKNSYKSKVTVEFKIYGIDFKGECIANINNGVPEVYYKGQMLIKDKDYWYNTFVQNTLINSVATGNGNLNTYKVVTYYTLHGRGKFDGVIEKKTETTEIKFETN